MKIHQLPDTIANKIAAGEVVERPASVIKELIENSIDANSSHIKIELTEAGMQKIIVTDNGDGMSPSDCKRAFLRHATSKIKYDTDLFRIKSLGFRGEALASIASVSKLTLISSQGNEAATELYLEGGQIIKERINDARKGTTMIVKELFYNTPARLKYLKSIHTELGHITDLLNRYALAYPSIRFELQHNKQTIFQTSGSGNKLQVIRQIYGMNVARKVLEAEKETMDFNIKGYFIKPEITRSNRRFITLIVNGRYIRNYPLAQAIIRGYDQLLPIHRYPIAIVYIELDPILIDVNVHPTKLEVRFSKEKELITILEQLVRNTFKTESLIPTMKRKVDKPRKTTQEKFHLQIDKKSNHNLNQQPEAERVLEPDLGNLEPSISFGENPTEEESIKENEEEVDISNLQVEQVTEDRIPLLYPIGQLQGTYILAQNELGFYMIDQHAAQERIKYEYYKEKLSKTENKEQQLLMPLTFEFTLDEKILIETYLEKLHSIGIKLEPFGPQAYTVRSHPTWFPEGLEEEIIREIIYQLIKDKKINLTKLREDLAILMACKRSIKANHYLNMEDMEQLLEQLRKTKDPFTCPHGRPVIIQFTYNEIEKMFKRIM